MLWVYEFNQIYSECPVVQLFTYLLLLLMKYLAQSSSPSSSSPLQLTKGRQRALDLDSQSHAPSAAGGEISEVNNYI